MRVRIGIGFDIHRLAAERTLMLGGIKIPYEKGLIGHSDGDVLLHAITDALLGACGLGNIGERFPNAEARYAGIDSQVLLRDTVGLVRAKGYAIGNIDCNILAERPKLLPHICSMQESIARVLDLSGDDVSVKAKTMEGLGPIGSHEAIAAQAVVTVFLQ